MADSIYKWSLTAASNDQADSIINWRENQLPDTVNDSARGMMQRVAEFREDLTGGLVTAGTQPAYTVATRAVFDSLADGRWFTCRVHATNAAGAATLNVNGLGAKAIRKFGTSGDMPLGVGDLQLGGLYQFMYSASGNAGAGAWVVPNPSIATGGGFASGTQTLFFNATAPVGWTKQTTHDNKALRIVSGTGGASAGTTAFTTVFASQTPNGTIGGTALTAAQMPAHSHTQQGTFNSGFESANHTHGFSVTTGGDQQSHTHNFTGTNNNTGSGAAYPFICLGPATNTITVGAQNQSHTHVAGGNTGGNSVNHTHGTTISGATTSAGSGETHAHTWTGAAMDFAVQYVDGIICMKD